MAMFRDFFTLTNERFDEENTPTVTSREQIAVEQRIKMCFGAFQQLQCLDHHLAQLYREEHIGYLERSLQRLPASYECLDCSRPWLVYWILNAATLLNFQFRDELLDSVVDFLIKCRHPENGGFGGGPGQFPHLATTYAAVNSLAIIGTKKAYEAMNKVTLKKFLWAVRDVDGSFKLHVGGEDDVRGAYCAISCAKLANFSKEDEEQLFESTPEWIASCQTYEGGFGGCPDLEAHGGYTFCALAASVMLGRTDKCDVEAILRWSLARQMRFEGGFQGRTNKLVDGCYSFWVGAIIPIAQAVLANKNKDLSHLLKSSMFDRSALQEYILLCCQKSAGGLIDKPGKIPDLYHTCYTLSGVAIAQHCENGVDPYVLGIAKNELLQTHPLHNIPPSAVFNAYKYFISGNSDNESQEKYVNEPENQWGNTVNQSSRSQSRETENTTNSSNEDNRETSVESASPSEYDESSSYTGSSSVN